LCQLYAEALKIKEYVIESIGFSLVLTAFNFVLILSPLFQPYGYDPLYIATFGVIFTVFGVIGSVIAGVLLDKYNCYLKLYRACCISCAVTFPIMLATVPTGNAWLVGINMAVSGFAVVPMGPVGISFAAELTFPLKETVTIGLLMLLAQAVSFTVATTAAILSTINP